MPKKYRPKVKGYVLPYIYVEDKLLVLVAMEKLKEPGEYYGTLLGGTSKNLRHIRESTARELCEETRGYMQIDKCDLLEYMKFNDKDRCTIYLLPLLNSYQIIHEINGFRNGVLMPPECSESSFIIALAVDELRSWTANKETCSDPYHYFKKPFVNKYPLASYRKFLQYFRRPTIESDFDPNFYLAHGADKMADFLPSAKNANFYLAHGADKMADFLPSAKNANFYLAHGADKMADFLPSNKCLSNCRDGKDKLKARTVSFNDSMGNETSSTDSEEISEEESEAFSERNNVRYSSYSSDTSSSSNPFVRCDNKLSENSLSPVPMQLEENFTNTSCKIVRNNQSSALNINASRSSALNINASRSSALDTNASRSSALDTNALKSSALDTNALKSSALDTNALKSSALDTNAVPKIIYYSESLSDNLRVVPERKNKPDNNSQFMGPKIWLGERLSRVLNTLDERILKKEHKNHAHYFEPFKNENNCCNGKVGLKSNSEQQPSAVRTHGKNQKGIPILHKKLKIQTDTQIHSI
jgi:hypothetical protein